MLRRIVLACLAASMLLLAPATAALAYYVPTAAQFQSGTWDLDLRPVRPVQISSFTDPNFGSNFSADVGTGSSRVLYSRDTNPDGSAGAFFVSVGGTCYVGCATGGAGGVGNTVGHAGGVGNG